MLEAFKRRRRDLHSTNSSQKGALQWMVFPIRTKKRAEAHITGPPLGCYRCSSRLQHLLPSQCCWEPTRGGGPWPRELPGPPFPSRQSLSVLFVFSFMRCVNPAATSLLLLKAGDIETNPGPRTDYICPKCNKKYRRSLPAVQCSKCLNWFHLGCTDLQSLNDYFPQWTCQICPKPNPSTQQLTPAPSDVNILQININGITNKQQELLQLLKKNNIHIAIIQESNLSPEKVLKQFPNYSAVRQDKEISKHSLLTLVHDNIPFSNTTTETIDLLNGDTTMNIQSIRIKLSKKLYNIVNIYIPPSTSQYCPPNYSPDLSQVATLPNLILAGDFNAHHHTWLTSQTDSHRGTHLITNLNQLTILNNRNQPTRKPIQHTQNSTSPDITFASPPLNLLMTWQTIHALSSDHLPILISLHHKHPLHTSFKKSYTNYNKANWPAFTEHIEHSLQAFQVAQFPTFIAAIKSFNNTITSAARRHIPMGYRRKFNPNFSPEVDQLIKQRNRLRQNNHPTQDQLLQITTLNNQITQCITNTQKNKWHKYIQNLDHKTHTTQLYRTIKKIHTSHTQPPPTHESIQTRNNKIPNPKEQCNLIMAHFSKISFKPTHRNNRKIIRNLKKQKIDTQAPPPFTTSDTSEAIKSLKNSKAEGPDKISNLHLKHLGPVATQKLTDILIHSWTHNIIPPFWKHAIIIPILKPNKDPKHPSSYRPISLLSTVSKLFEKLILKLISPSLPTVQHQHGFKPKHSTTTLLTDLTQDILSGFNENPPLRTVMVAIDINKAFDTVPRHLLIEKIRRLNLHPNNKHILANFLSGRTACVQQRHSKSKTFKIHNGVPQGAILSPSLFNLFTHDLPIPTNPAIKLRSYADDLTITSQHCKVHTATSNLQPYMDSIQRWLTLNRMEASPQKSTVTLLTSHKKESHMHPYVKLYNSRLPLNRTPIILGLTFDPHMTFTPHIHNITAKVNKKLNALRTLAGTTFGQSKETLTSVYRSFVRSNINYAAMAWTSDISHTNAQRLETLQNSALRIITGCLPSTPIHHLQAETKILPISTHLDMLGCQAYSRTLNSDHPLHNILRRPLGRRRIKTTPATYYSNLYNIIPPPPPNINPIKHIHTHMTQEHLLNRPPNTILGLQPPDIAEGEQSLERAARVSLSRMRCGHHHALQQYQFCLNRSDSPNCLLCADGTTQDARHLFLHCRHFSELRDRLSVSSLEDLWSDPVGAARFLREAGLLNSGMAGGVAK